MAHVRFGAEMGNGVGIQGQSYAIPTMQGGVETIKPYVDQFLAFASQHKELHSLVTLLAFLANLKLVLKFLLRQLAAFGVVILVKSFHI